jgi:hypothetical protein
MSAAGAVGYFALLSRDEQVDAIHRLSRAGMTDHGIAAVTMLSVEQIRSILGQRQRCEGCDE